MKRVAFFTIQSALSISSTAYAESSRSASELLPFVMTIIIAGILFLLIVVFFFIWNYKKNSIIIEAAVKSSKGNVRQNNEDNFFLNGRFMALQDMDNGATLSQQCMKPLQIYAVCDGMGGEEAGEEASFIAVENLVELYSSLSHGMDTDVFKKWFIKTSDNIFQKSQDNRRKSGTTIACCLWCKPKLYLAHVGDSRIYLFRNDKLTRLTTDHSEVERMIKMGLITPEEAVQHPKKHIISQYLGISSTDIQLDPCIVELSDFQNNDILLLCSDGLTDMLDDNILQQIFTKAESVQQATNLLVKYALKAGGHDNVTVLCLRYRTKKLAGQKN